MLIIKVDHFSLDIFATFVFLSSGHLIHYSLVYLSTNDFSTFFDFVFFLSLIFFSQVDLCVCIYVCVFICISVPVCGCLWRQDDYHQCHFFSIAFWFLCDYSSSSPGPHCRLGPLTASPETHLSLFSSSGSTVLWVCTPQPSCIMCASPIETFF